MATGLTNDALKNLEDGEESAPLDINNLIGDNITAKDISLLKMAHLHSVNAVANSTRKSLLAIPGLGETKVTKILSKASKMVPNGFVSASTFYRMRADVVMLTTGSKELDKLLGGGIETGSITEIFGEFRCGKTQICHTLAVTCQLPISQKGGEGKCLYIDTDSSFRPERLSSIAPRFGLNINRVLENVNCSRAYNTDQQTSLVQLAAGLLGEARYALVIVDSVIGLYRTDYPGMAELADRQNHLGLCVRQLRRLADEFGVAVVITNQVTDVIDGDNTYGWKAKKPVGGHILAHASTTRLYLRKGEGQTRLCKLYESPCLPESETMFAILPDGIGDAKEN